MLAYSGSKTPKEDRDKRQTPVSVFNRIQELINIPLVHDVCAEDHTAKCKSFWTEKDDSLSKAWMDEAEIMPLDCSTNFAFWMNPPYSDPATWCAKAYLESKRGLIIVGLLPDDRSTKWYQNWIEDRAAFVYVPDKRISFENAEGEPQKGNPKGSIFPVWMPMRFDKTQYIRIEL